MQWIEKISEFANALNPWLNKVGTQHISVNNMIYVGKKVSILMNGLRFDKDYNLSNEYIIKNRLADDDVNKRY